jgi:hypothetical protein
VEATLKSPSKAPKKAVPKPAPTPDWKLWKQKYLDGGVRYQQWGDWYTTQSCLVDRKVPPPASIICGCCGAPWIQPGGKVLPYNRLPGVGREEAIPFSTDLNFPDATWKDRQGIYFGEFQDVATLRKDMGLEDEEVFKSFEIHDGDTTHALVWKEIV